jgi:hypothetical protein
MHIAFSSEDTQTSVLVALHHPHSTLRHFGRRESNLYIYIISLTKRELSKQGKENEMEKMKNLSPVINRFFFFFFIEEISIYQNNKIRKEKPL